MNRHAVASRERDADKQATEKATAQKARDDAEWDDSGDKQGGKKAARKADTQDKDAAAKARKAENARVLAEEEKANEHRAPDKVLRKEEQKKVAQRVANHKAQSSGVVRQSHDPLPKGSMNQALGADADDAPALSPAAAASATNRAAIEDRHIGKRARVAYKKFFALNVDAVKDGKQRLRRTQVNDVMWALWQKSPENPFVQRAETMAEQAARRSWFEDEADDDDEEEADE
jgi:hypothetical protein